MSDIPQNKNRDFGEITSVEKNYYLKTGSKGSKQANLDVLKNIHSFIGRFASGRTAGRTE